MNNLPRSVFIVILLCFSAVLESSELAPMNREPNIRMLPQYPLSSVETIAFHPITDRLYMAGRDKVVHCWKAQDEGWVYDLRSVLRIPIGGGFDGTINVQAISPEGRYLAVGGRFPKRGVAGQMDRGINLDAETLTEDQKQDEGLIFVFDLQDSKTIVLRGHAGAIVGLAFCQGANPSEPRLISLCTTFAQDNQTRSEVFLWDLAKKTPLARLLTDASGRPLPAINPSRVPEICPLNGTDLVGISWKEERLGFRIWNFAQNRLGEALPENDIYQVFGLLDETEEASQPRILAGVGDMREGRGKIVRWHLTPEGQWAKKTTSRILSTLSGQSVPQKMCWANETSGDLLIAHCYDFKTRKQLIHEISTASGAVQQTFLETDAKNRVPWAWSPQRQCLSWTDSNHVPWCRFRGEQERAVSLVNHRSAIAFQQSHFVQNGDHLGLKLQGKATNSTRVEHLFNLTTSRTVENPANWEVPRLEGRSPVVLGSRLLNQTFELTIQHPLLGPAAKTYNIPLNSLNASQVDLVGIIPCTNIQGRPLFVVAFNVDSDPHLGVYHFGEAALLVREYQSHTGPLTSLDLSPNQNLLVTTATDSTTRLWWLGDLEQHVGRSGTIRDRHEQLQVKSLEEALVIQRDCQHLRAGDQITGITVADDSFHPKTSWEFYSLLLRLRPGTSLQVLTQRGEIECQVEQATEIVRELCTLYFEYRPQDERPPKIEWVCWRPQGQFDCHSVEIENYLGWHFNTDNPDQPVRFVRMGEFGEDYRRPGLLPELIGSGQLAALAIPDDLHMLVQIQRMVDEQPQVLEQDHYGKFFLRHPGEKLLVHCEIGAEISHRQIREVRWELRHDFRQVIASGTSRSTIDNEWEFPIALPEQSERGFYDLTIFVDLHGSSESISAYNGQFRYQPKPPVFEVAAIPKVVKTLTPEITLTTGAVTEDAPVDFQLAVYDDQGEVYLQQTLNEITAKKKPETLIALNLKEGYNKLEVIASNRNPLAGFESYETQRFVTEFLVIPMEQTPPPLLHQMLIVLKEPQQEQSKFNLLADQNLVFEQQDVQLNIVLHSVRSLEDVQLTHQEKPQAISPEILAHPEQLIVTSVQQPVTLHPGVNTLCLTASDTAGEKLERTFEIVHAPPLPQLSALQLKSTLIHPDALSKTIAGPQTIIDEIHEPAVEVSAMVEGDFDENLFEPTFQLLRGSEVVDNVVAKFDEGTITFAAPLLTGSQQFSICVNDRWGRKTQSPTLLVHRVKLPTLLSHNFPESLDSGFLEPVDLEIESPSFPISAEMLRVQVNEKPIRLPLPVAIREQEAGRYFIRLESIPVDEPEWNNLALIFHNSQIKNEVLFSGKILQRSETLKKPELSIGLKSGQVDETQISLPVTVFSKSEVELVTVSLNHDVILQLPASELREKKNSDSPEEDAIRLNIPISITQTSNRLQVEAQNRNGITRSDIVELTYVKPPPNHGFIQIESGAEVALNGSQNYLGTSTSARVTCRGDVRFPSPPDKSALPYQVWVNGFKQKTGRLEPIPGDARAFSFRFEVTLNQENENVMELKGFPRDVSMHEHFLVDCSNPVKNQNLYLILAGISAEGEVEVSPALLVEKAKRALQVQVGANQQLLSEAFRRIRIDDKNNVLTERNVTQTKINTAIARLSDTISAGSSNNISLPVVIVYYYGSENQPTDLSDYSPTLAAYRNQEIKLSHLSKWLSRVDGAHLVLLDVATQGQNWPRTVDLNSHIDPFLGVMRVRRNSNTVTVLDNPPLMSGIESGLPFSKTLGDLHLHLYNSFSGVEKTQYEAYIPYVLQRLRLGKP